MNKPLFILLFLIFNSMMAQQSEVLHWINNNAAAIDITALPDKTMLDDQLTDKLKQAKIIGVGEATHNHKEFWQVKTLLFKYLVLYHGVRYFALEESFSTAYTVNNYIQGQPADIKSFLPQFRQKIWNNEQMLMLIEWMRDYNSTHNAKISFYGIDCMFNHGLSSLINNILKENNFPLDTKTLDILNRYQEEKFIYNNNEFLDNDAKELQKLHDSVIKLQFPESDKAANALTALIGYIKFSKNPQEDVRDKIMAGLIIDIMESKVTEEKIFIWAHNDHIKKTTLNKSSYPSMGNHLFKNYGSSYYSVGTDFGTGALIGLNRNNNWEHSQLTMPIKGTYAEILYKATPEIYFIDFERAEKDNFMREFLSSKRDYLMIGGYGLIAKNYKYALIRAKLDELYDSLVFIKKVTLTENK